VFGDACSTSADCGAHLRCLPHGAGNDCECDPTYRVCGTTCVDLANDPHNCGGCGTVCTGSNVCSRGLCVASAFGPLGPLFSVDAGSVQAMSPYDAGLGSRSNESVPEHSANGSHILFEGHNYFSIGPVGNQWNHGPDSTSNYGGAWQNAAFLEQNVVDGGSGNTWSNGGDPGATTSSVSARDYLSYVIGDTVSNNCIGVTSGTASSSSWDTIRCVNPYPDNKLRLRLGPEDST
jgi:hypothetical protein